MAEPDPRDETRRGHPKVAEGPSINLVAAAADRELDGVPVQDLRGLNCPLPALKAGARLSRMGAGERVWVETTDPLASIDIPAMARERGHTLVEARKADDGMLFLIERGAD